VEPLLLHDVAIDCQFVNEIDDHDDHEMPRAGPRDLANQALRYGTMSSVTFVITSDKNVLTTLWVFHKSWIGSFVDKTT
jgi:hypothetical protein